MNGPTLVTIALAAGAASTVTSPVRRRPLEHGVERELEVVEALEASG